MSWSRQQSDDFAAQGAALRSAVSGTECTYSGDGRTYMVAISGVRSQREPVPGGFEPDHDFTARLARAANPAFTPALGAQFTIKRTGVVYRIDEIIDNPTAPEWVLKLKAFPA